MRIAFPIHTKSLELDIPDHAAVYSTSYPAPPMNSEELVLHSVANPAGSSSLKEKVISSNPDSVVIVASDITRPIPYAEFLGSLLHEIEACNINKKNITILIATGMHRPSSREERLQMFGSQICANYSIIDHYSDKPDQLITIEGQSHSGRKIELNRHYIEADFRIVTGLVEPHFMAGFSGGRKAVCPGLCSLETVKAFHSFGFLDNSDARNGNLEGNPLHSEALSIAHQAGVDFCINLVINKEQKIVAAYSGDLEQSHEAACEFVRKHACPPLTDEFDVVLTSSGGYPLDATFYQCIKGMVAALPLVRERGTVIAAGGCAEGVGSKEYQNILFNYSDRWQSFVEDFKTREDTVKDQWEFQMQTKVLAKTGQNNLYFLTSGIEKPMLDKLSVNGRYTAPPHLERSLQKLIDEQITDGKTLAVLPEGPYCTPLS